MSDMQQPKYAPLQGDDAITVAEAVPALKRENRYTYADLCAWGEDERWELIDGKAYAMSAPTAQHQSVLLELSYHLRHFLKGKPCKVFVAPFDVRLNADTTDDTVLQPDVLVICDRDKITRTSCVGAPDLVIEILSPSTAAHDRIRKLNLYRQYGVREYWIVDPEIKNVTAHILDNGRYYIASYTETDTVPVHVLEGCVIDLREIFSEE